MEAIVKSLLCGLVAGFATSFAAALALWIIDKGFWWLALVAIAAVINAIKSKKAPVAVEAAPEAAPEVAPEEAPAEEQ